ncbi:MAG TPA: MBL fold metallo-hydrolase [Solirubrobacteraceae bacterium]|jgi:glyoxylase-like metal-dependent hydrolase (beta-lactamase superfamily II)|nr:MBL fold metallo-hydrolase [Solirubrobacteraceae bacterium]
MRAVALHSDVIVFVSDMWQTTCTAVRGGDEGFVIDSVLYPEELRALPSVLEQAGFAVSGLLTTHGDWDHLLGRIAFPGAALGASDATVERLSHELGEAQRELRAFDHEQYVEDRPPLALGSLQSLPVPGHLEIGAGAEAHEIELHPTGGHTVDGVAFWLAWANVLVCGDYLSPVEIPALSPGGSITVYRATLERLKPLAEQAEWVVPGHGAPYPGQRALQILGEDEAYLMRLEADPDGVSLPAGRSTVPQKRLHAGNVAFVTG